MELRSCGWLAVLLVAPVVTGCDIFSSPLLSACEEVVKSRLLAPAGYERVGYIKAQEDVDMVGWVAFLRRYNPSRSAGDVTNEAVVTFRSETKPKKLVLLLTYDAPNAYGAPIRSQALCEYYSRSGTDKGARTGNVLVDGELN